jgi:hypothetical protein
MISIALAQAFKPLADEMTMFFGGAACSAAADAGKAVELRIQSRVRLTVNHPSPPIFRAVRE